MSNILKENYDLINLSSKTHIDKKFILDGKTLKEDIKSSSEKPELNLLNDNSTNKKNSQIGDFLKNNDYSESNNDIISKFINLMTKRDFNTEEERKTYINNRSKKLTIYLEEFDDNFNSISRAEEEVISISEKKGFNILGEILQQIVLDNFDKPKTLSALCQCLRRFDLDEVCPWGPIIIIALLNNSDENVKADAIALIDNWEDISLLPMLRGLDCRSTTWLKTYVENVIKLLEV